METKIRCELISWSKIERLSLQLAKQMLDSDFYPDVVVAIGRGGYVPARLLCDYLDIMALTSIKIELYHHGAQKADQANSTTVNVTRCERATARRDVLLSFM